MQHQEVLVILALVHKRLLAALGRARVVRPATPVTAYRKKCPSIYYLISTKIYGSSIVSQKDQLSHRITGFILQSLVTFCPLCYFLVFAFCFLWATVLLKASDFSIGAMTLPSLVTTFGFVSFLNAVTLFHVRPTGCCICRSNSRTL